jgi:2-polyprenyl-3-methyl-5-hydroxy-6-metoxy-1,4-benzoquinol methylase
MTDYDRLHKEWDNVHFECESPTYQMRKKIILMTIEQLFPARGEYTCLDVGCGTGDYSFELSKRNFRVLGFDFSQYAIDKCKQKAQTLDIQNVHFYSDNIFQFSTSEKFDLILISEVLEHIHDDMAILKKYSDYVKSSGYIVVSVPFDQKLWSYEDEHAGHVRRYTLNRIREMFINANMELITSICYGFPLLHIIWKIKSIRSTRSKQRTNMVSTSARFLPIKYFGKLIVFFDSLFINSKMGVGIIVVAKKI